MLLLGCLGAERIWDTVGKFGKALVFPLSNHRTSLAICTFRKEDVRLCGFRYIYFNLEVMGENRVERWEFFREEKLRVFDVV